MIEQDGIIFIGQNKFDKIKKVTIWSMYYKLRFNLIFLANASIKDLIREGKLARKGKKNE